ncbi:MAG: rRNA small subunit methyltransferase, partial [Pyrinomonadaceae bacterium]|nr:rRNA small subunit methyltransferase [Pyrinomonadaceae bacterium]
MNPTFASSEFRKTLASKAGDYEVSLSSVELDGLVKYYDLLNAWNARLHLVAPCAPREFATRHV